jgi:putative addiction module component (TIGR02574 family)
MSLEEIATMTLGLSQDERAWLAGRLLESLDGPQFASAAERQWAAEIEHRVREVAEGRVELVPSETVLADGSVRAGLPAANRSDSDLRRCSRQETSRLLAGTAAELKSSADA